MTPLVLPITSDALSARIAAHWGGERGVARAGGVNPAYYYLGVFPDGMLGWSCTLLTPDEKSVVRAIAFLLDALEDEGLAVDRESGRVLGWAAARCSGCSGSGRVDSRSGEPDISGDECLDCGGSGLVAIVSLDITDPRRSAHFEAVREARAKRRAPMPTWRAEQMRRNGR